MTPILFIDTETTGVHPRRKVWEIAMIRRDENGEKETVFFVEVDLSDADPFGLNIGRFYERHPEGRRISGRTPTSFTPGLPPLPAASQEWAAREVARVTHGAHLVGAVPNFDAETLAPLLREHRLIPAWHYHLIDVEALAVGYVSGVAARAIDEAKMRGEAAPNIDWSKSAPPWNSNDLSRAVGVDPEQFDRHTALGDAKWARAIYDAVTKGGSE